MTSRLSHHVDQAYAANVSPSTLRTLLNVAGALSSSLELERVLQTAIESACDLFGLQTGAIYVLDGEAMHLGATTPPLEPGFPDEFRHLRLEDHPHVGESLSTTRPIYLSDARTASLSPSEREISEVRGLRSILYIPLLLESRSVGVLILGSTDAVREFEESDIDIARIFAAQASLTVANARLFESVRRSNAEVTQVNENLEQLVDARTSELASANEELQCQAEELQCQAEELEMQSEELAQMNEAKERFMRSMSHELRTPLTSIIGFSGMMLEGLVGELTDEQRVQLGMVHSSGKHLLAIMSDLLDLGRIEAGELRLSHEHVDLPRVVEECLRLVSPEAEEKGLVLASHISEPVPRLRSDVLRVRQILLNLVANAVKFTDRGQVSVRVGTPEPGVVEIAVSDTGPGIAEGDLDVIFGEFEQLLRGRDRSSEGTGLGLAISRQLAYALGGGLSVESRVGEGSTFTLRLPLEARQ